MEDLTETDLLRPVKTKKITEEILERLSALIREGIWQPGEKVPPERQLAEMLKVGRSSVREAVKSLEFMGLVQVRPGEGTFVSAEFSGALGKAVARAMALSQQDALDLIEARQVIECYLAGLAAQRIEEPELAQLRQYLEEMERNVNRPKEFLKADLHFHMSVAQAGHNQILFRVFLTVRELLAQLIGQALTAPGTAEAAAAAHARILEAVEAGDARGAEQAMRVHLADIKHRVVGILDSG